MNKANNLILLFPKRGISHTNGSAKDDLYHTCHRFTSKKPTSNKITVGVQEVGAQGLRPFRSMANATLRYQEFRRKKFLPNSPNSVSYT
ncbi:hypothetical protein, partial [Dolichospermum sp. LEGE 00246]|uniref:hypothetical protein n=2 Tax=Aphanizomenonaceae TaxID=1892259 RepID=UPI001D152E17